MTGPRAAASFAGSAVTVRGPVAPSSLGAASVGEHLVSSFATPEDTDAGWARVARERPRAATEVRFSRLPVTIDVLGRLAMGAYLDDDLRLDERTATEGATAFAGTGGGTIVELTPAGCSPDAAALARVAERTGVHLVRAAGWQGTAWSPELAGVDAPALAGRLVAEVVGHPHPAGVIVVGPFEAADASAEALLEASGRAALVTGAPLVLRLDGLDERLGIDAGSVHAGRAARADRVGGADLTARTVRAEQLAVRTDAARAAIDLLLASGLAPERIALAGASALLADRAALSSMLERGVCLLFDGLGRIPTVRTEVADHDVAVAVLELAGRGAADRVLLGSGIAQRHRLTAFGGNGYEFVPAQFAPYLGMLGAEAELLEAATAGNAARFLTFAEPEPAA